jgi:hypothetical protein
LRTTGANVLGDLLIPELGAKMIRRTIELDNGSVLVVKISRRHKKGENE